jgi:hypothetical protein
MEAESVVMNKDINLSLALLESWFKSVKNGLQTSRSHINALSGKEDENEE